MPRGSLSAGQSVHAVVDEGADEVGHEEFHSLRRKSLAAGHPQRTELANLKISDIESQFNTDLKKGLTAQQVERLLEDHGPNLLHATHTKPFWRILLEQLNVLNILVLAVAILMFVQGVKLPNGVRLGEEPDVENGCILLAIVFLCMVVGGYMEWKCTRVMADISRISAPTTTVTRDGRTVTVDAACVVPGDVVELQASDVVPADGLVFEVADCYTNEVVLTGEPHEMLKTVRPEDPCAPFPSNFVYATTSVVSGRARAVIVRTGMSTEIGKIAEHLKHTEAGLTPVQKTMNKIGRIVTLSVIVLVGALFGISYGWKVNDPADPCKADDNECFFQKSLMRSLFWAVGAIPETLQPAVMCLLVLGCKQLVNVKAATRKLSAIDIMGSCSFIASDKTGTLTEGKMTCMYLLPRVRGMSKKFAFYPTAGFNPRGGVFDAESLTDHAKASLLEADDVNRVQGVTNFAQGSSPEALLVRSCMEATLLNSYGTKLIPPDSPDDATGFTVEGNMSEGALVVAAAKAGLSEAEHGRYPREQDVEVPFSSSRKMMVTIHKLPTAGQFESVSFSGASHVAVIKGAPDVLLPYIKGVLQSQGGKFAPDGKPFDEADKRWYEEQNAELAGKALRVLCVCLRPLTQQDVQQLRGKTTDARVEKLLAESVALLSLLGLMDPPREDAKDAVAHAHKAGIRVAMITGDQKRTAVAVAKELGIMDSRASDDAERVQECAILANLNEADHQDEIDELCNNVVVWSRAMPSDKVTIIKSLQRQGHTVAMTGDGVNDAGALKHADIGLAMGINGTEVAKAASDIVLLDDRFATIVDSIQEGRRVFENIQKILAFLLCVNIFEVIAIGLAMIIGWSVPLEDAQLFKANLVTHEFYPWVLVFEPASWFGMQQPPRSRRKPIIPRLNRNVLCASVFICYIGVMLMSQYAGSMLYVGTPLRDEQMGTDSLKEFYDEKTNFVCLYANTLQPELEAGKGGASKLVYEQDAAPIHCYLKKRLLSGWVTYAEYGRPSKPNKEDAIAAKDGKFDWFTGTWGDYFSLENSIFKGDLGEGKSLLDFQGNDILVKCSQLKRGDIRGSEDKLCWKECGERDDTRPYLCWEQKFLDDDDEEEVAHAPNGMLQLVADTEYREKLRTPARHGEPPAKASYVEVNAEGRFGNVARSRKLENTLSQGGAMFHRELLAEDKDEDDDEDDDDERDEPPEKPTLYKQFNCATWGIRQMRSVVLLTMVLMEFLMLFGFAKHEFAFFDLMGNKVFIYVWPVMLAVLLWYVYSPVHVFDHEFAPLDFLGFLVSLSMALLFYATFEITKVLHRYWFKQELEGKKAVARLAAEGRLKAFASRKEAWKQYPDRRPLLA